MRAQTDAASGGMFSRQGGPCDPPLIRATRPTRTAGRREARKKVLMKRVPVDAERPDRTTATVADAEKRRRTGGALHRTGGSEAWMTAAFIP